MSSSFRLNLMPADNSIARYKSSTYARSTLARRFFQSLPKTESGCPISLTITCKPASCADRDRGFDDPPQPADRSPGRVLGGCFARYAIRPAVQLVQSIANFTLCDRFFHLAGSQPFFNGLSPIGRHRYLFRLAR